MERVFQLVLGLFLVFLAVVLTAVGVQLAAVGAVVCAVLLAGGFAAWGWHRVRHGRQHTDAKVATDYWAGNQTAIPGGPPAVSSPVAADVEYARLLRRRVEPPERKAERDGIRSDARRVSSTYRAMGALQGIASTDNEARLSWLERIMALQRRRDDYAGRWEITLPDADSFSPLVPPVRPDWLEAMARAADEIAWQLDREDGGPVIEHKVAAVGGTRITCTCGRTFDTGPTFAAHQQSGT